MALIRSFRRIMLDYMLLLFILTGFVLGICSGLTPGLHTNNFASLLLAISPILLSQGVEPYHLASTILAASITHTFVDIIPSVFIGAPDADTALAVLPGHNMMLDGRGIEAIRLSALGSAASVLVAMILICPLSYLFGNFYDQFMEHMGLILFSIVSLMIITERGPYVEGQGSLVHLKYKAISLIIFLVSGFLGCFAFQHEELAKSFLNLEPQVLLPLLSGLFGASLLILSLATNAKVPAQRETNFDLPFRSIAKSAFLGGLSGSVVAWVPGVTPAVATVVTRFGSIGSDREFLISISGVNTANALFALVALQVVGRPRSGAAIAIKELVEIDQKLMILMVIIVLGTALASYLTTLWMGRLAAKVVRRLNYKKLCLSVLVFLAGMTFIFAGFFGLFLFFLATLIGIIPSLIGIRKIHTMGVLMLPLLITYL